MPLALGRLLLSRKPEPVAIARGPTPRPGVLDITPYVGGEAKIDGVERPSKSFVGPRFYFNKDEGVVVTADDIDLTPGASAKITIKDIVTVPPQKPAGQLLPASPKLKMLGTRSRKPAAPPVRKIGDGSDKAHAHAI